MKNFPSKIIFIYLINLLILVSSGFAGQMHVGVAVVDITGDDAVILDPLHVKAIVFRQGFEQVALVECDQTFAFGDLTSQARKLASEKTGIPYSNICIAATHTHMAKFVKPDLQDYIVKAIVNAQAAAKPVKMQAGCGQEYKVAFNRRYFMKDGTVMFNPMFLNPDIVRPAGPIDPDVGIVIFRSPLDDRVIASLTNYALHCDTVKEYGAKYSKKGEGSKNSVSADYPYWLEESLRKDFGRDFVSIFTTGCCGNINHWDFSKPGPQSGHKTKAKHIGQSLAAAVEAELPKLKNSIPSLASRTRILQVPLQNYSAEDLSWAKQLQNTKLSSHSEEISERQLFLNKKKKEKILALNEMRDKGQTAWPLDVQVFRLSDDTAIVTLPGEMFVEHGLTIKNLSPFENTIVITLANNYCEYVPNRKAFPQGGYEVVRSRLAPGGGEMMVEAAVQMLKELKEDLH